MVLLPAIDRKKQVGDQAAKNPDHQPVLALGYQVIHLEVAFPPDKERLDAPAGFIDLSHFFCRQVEPVGGDPVILTVNMVTNKAQLFLSLVYTVGAEKHYSVIEDNTVSHDGVFSDDGFVRILPDPANKELLGGLPLVKVVMGLLPSVHDAGFAFFDDLVNKGALTLFTVAQVYLPGNASVDIEADMGLGLL